MCPALPPDDAGSRPPAAGMPALTPLPGLLGGANELLAAATAPSKLCLMEPTWHPWF
jgi:hypothetical protein